MTADESTSGCGPDGHATPEADGLTQEDESYRLLNDQPLQSEEKDLLGTEQVAEGIASILIASMNSSPFVLALDAGWGMGKSTLLRQIEERLPNKPGFKKVRFNAWTAEGENALEGLIKTVLVELDPSFVRRWVRKLGRNQRIVGFARISSVLVGRFVGIGRLVDELWNQMAMDAKSRNELRGLIHGMLLDWTTRDGKRDPNRVLVVFVDDLDRCSDDVVVKVCEAVKLYLDAPGLIFVLACDQSVLARGVSSSARGGMGEGRSYLEKIVQVVYRVPPPDDKHVKELIGGYAGASRTAKLFDDSVKDILVERAGRNPRKIKRIINSFVLEYRLDKAWRTPPLGSAQLITAVLLQHLYPSFYDLLVSEESKGDFIGEFLDYAFVRERASDPPLKANDPWWDVVRRAFSVRRLAAPGPFSAGSDPTEEDRRKLAERFQDLERAQAEDFLTLARNDSLITLLREVGDDHTRESLRAQLIRRPLVTETIHAERGVVLSRLVRVMTELYPSSREISRVADYSGLNRALIDTSAPPVDVAYQVVHLADQNGKLNDIVEAMRRDYPANPELERLPIE